MSLSFAIFFTIATLAKATEAGDVDFVGQMEGKALAGYVEMVAKQCGNRGRPIYLFLKTRPQIEERVLSSHHYNWLVREAEVELQRDSSYRMKKNVNQYVDSVSVSGLEKTGDQWRCIITLYGGNTGSESVRCYFGYVDKEWRVVKIVEDAGLPIS